MQINMELDDVLVKRAMDLTSISTETELINTVLDIFVKSIASLGEEKVFYKFRAITDNTIDSLRDNYFYFSDKDELNDPFDLNIPTSYSATDEEIINLGNKHNVSLENIYKIIDEKKLLKDTNLIESVNKVYKQNIGRIKIFCVSEVWDEELMWGHYADSFKGICFGYNTYFKNGSYLFKLEDDAKTGTNYRDENGNYIDLHSVKYKKTELKNFNIFIHDDKAILEGIKHKRQKWCYEKEYRALFLDDVNQPLSKKVKYSKSILVEIIIGHKTKKDQIKKIIEIVDAEYDISKIKFYKIIIPDDNLKLKRYELNFKDYLI